MSGPPVGGAEMTFQEEDVVMKLELTMDETPDSLDGVVKKCRAHTAPPRSRTAGDKFVMLPEVPNEIVRHYRSCK